MLKRILNSLIVVPAKGTRLVKQSSGFTLIELLFIIVIVGVVVSIVLSSHQLRLINIKVDQTAIQMQQISEAANAFNADNGSWPSSTNPPPLFLQNYLPVGISANPWGQAYIYGQDPNQSSNFLVYSGALPNTQIANQIASVLPNAAIDQQNPQQVITSFASIMPSNQIQIQTIGGTNILQHGDSGSFPAFKCPGNRVAHAIAVPFYIEPKTYPYRGLTNPTCPTGSAPFGTLYLPLSSPTSQSPNWTYTAQFAGYVPNVSSGCPVPPAFSPVWRTAGQVAFVYIGWCAPQ